MNQLNLEAETNYQRAQQRLASFRDRNQNIILSTNRTEEQRLQSEYDMAFRTYQSVSQLREQAIIKVQEKTPAFTIIEPALIATRSSPKTSLIMSVMIFLGLMTGAMIVLGWPAIKRFREELTVDSRQKDGLRL